MTNCVEEFEGLLKDMEQALVANDLDRINQLTIEQQRCLSTMVVEVRDNKDYKQLLQSKMSDITFQLNLNLKLLEQAMTLTNDIIVDFYKTQKSTLLSSDCFTA